MNTPDQLLKKVYRMTSVRYDQHGAHYAAWLTLSSVDEFNYQIAIAILQRFGSLVAALDSKIVKDEIKSGSGSKQLLLTGAQNEQDADILSIIGLALETARVRQVKKQVSDMLRDGVQIYPMIGSGYPHSLFDLTDPPMTIYVRGKLPSFEKSVAIVGTRDPTEYGKMMAYRIAKHLASKGYVIVSGLAYGVDSQAHTGALDAGGTTVAVLPSYVGNVVPKGNLNLANRILTNSGALISEHPVGTRVRPHMFVQRNRIIAALARQSIIIEASLESGTRHQAAFAKELKRPIFVLEPQDATVRQAELPIYLKNEGAISITEADDVIEAIEGANAERRSS